MIFYWINLIDQNFSDDVDDLSALLEKTTTITVELSIALRRAEAYLSPGAMSLGTIQHRILFSSSLAQIASAISLSSKD